MLNLAILGAGSIARQMAATVRKMNERGDGVALYAVASRSGEKARAFAKAEGAALSFDSYEAMLRDDKVDLVYIATPHALHAEQMLLCLQYGKPVLCEKAFTGNARQAEQVLNAFEQKGVLATEAIWTRYMPSRQMVNEIIASGEIGEVRLLTANLGYDVLRKERIVRPELAGGALLDLGVYTLNFASMVLGDDVERTDSQVTMLPSGVDREEDIVLHYRSGVSAHLLSTAVCRTDRHGMVYGTKGYLQVDNINNPQRLEVFDTNDRLLRALPVPEQLTGYEYEVLACKEALQNGRTECPQMPHDQTLRMMRQMDALREKWGMRYPFD